MVSKRTEQPTDEAIASAPETDPERDKELVTHAPVGVKVSGVFVKHNPMNFFSIRIIRKEQWESIGIHDQVGVEWNEENNFRLPKELFTEQALAYLLKQDNGFELVK